MNQFKVTVWSPESHHKADRERWGFGNHYFDDLLAAQQFAFIHRHGTVNATIYARRPEPIMLSGNLSLWEQMSAVIGHTNMQEGERA